MGGAVGLKRDSKRIAHLGAGDDIPFANAEELTEFDVSGVFVTMAGTALFDAEESFDVSSGRGFAYLQPLDEQWVNRTATTLSVFTTPTASMEGESFNPLAEISEETFVTDRGGRYLAESGMLSASGLGSNVSWVVSPAEVGSRSSTLFDKCLVLPPEPVIESVTYEAAGFGNCVHQLQSPAGCRFGQRVLECSGYRDSSAV